MTKQLVLRRVHKEVLVNLLDGHHFSVEESFIRELELAGLVVSGTRTLTPAGREQADILKRKFSSV